MCTKAPSPPIAALPATGSAEARRSASRRPASGTSASVPDTRTVHDPSGTFATWAASATTTLASAPDSREATASDAKAVNSGTYTAPARQVPSSTVTRSTLLPISVATRSPRPTPSSARTPANRSERSRSSPKLRSAVEPSGETNVNATASPGWRSHISHAGSASDAEKIPTSSLMRSAIAVGSGAMHPPLGTLMGTYDSQNVPAVDSHRKRRFPCGAAHGDAGRFSCRPEDVQP
jgi:hypothetical protein